MTGFGDASSQSGDARYAVEIRSVNNKYFKTVFRLPEELAGLEPLIDQALRRRLQRGSVTVTVSCAETGAGAAAEIDTAALTSYIRQLERVGATLPGAIDVASLLTLPGVLHEPMDAVERLARARKAVLPLVDEAMDKLIAMREREGQSLRDDLMRHHAIISAGLTQIGQLAPGVVAEYERRLKQRIEMLLSETDADVEPPDLVREIAVYAERTDIAEEIARLGEHLNHFRDLLESDEDRPLGRTLDFLAQELLREANTIASKSPDAKMARLIVDIKGAIDRIKEQVQNAE